MCSNETVNCYLVELRDREDHASRQTITVFSPCPHSMQEFVGGLKDLKVANPEVVEVTEPMPSKTQAAESA